MRTPVHAVLTVTVALALALLLAALTIRTSGADVPVGGRNVTNSPAVAADLVLAARYWRAAVPAVPSPSCGMELATVDKMTSAADNYGRLHPASAVFAETADGSCVINVSQLMWNYLRSRDSYRRYTACTAFAHEYGHSLGMPDRPGNTLMNSYAVWSGENDPLCAQAIYGWTHITAAAQHWLTAHRLQPSSR